MNMTLQNKRLSAILLSVPVLLLIPFISMQFTHEVSWSWFDFVIAAVLLTGTGLLCELVMRKIHKRQHRLIVCGVVLAALFLVWAELAVGIFGTPFAGN